MMKNLNGTLVEMSPEEEAAHLALFPTEAEILETERAKAVSSARDAARIRILNALVDADPEHQAAVAAIQKAATQDEISAAVVAAWKK